MATSPFRTQVNSIEHSDQINAIRQRNLETIHALVDGFARQDIDLIMAQFAENACYYDIVGRAHHGGEAEGKAAIQSVFLRQFAAMGPHSYADSVAVADMCTGFASWTLILGDIADPRAQRFAGIDEFWFDKHGKVIVKKAWMKGIPRLAFQTAWRNPKGLRHHITSLLRGASL